MKKMIAQLIRIAFMAGLALLIFGGSVYYEGNFVATVASQKINRLTVWAGEKDVIRINRSGNNVELYNDAELEVGDIVETGDLSEVLLKYAGDGEMRLDRDTRLLIKVADQEHLFFSFKLLEGRAWLNNAYSNADVNFFVDGAVIFPGQSSILVTESNGKSDIYSDTMDAVVGFLPVDYAETEILNEHSDQIINRLYLPQGTMCTVFAEKINKNQATIAKLLFSKLVKEFNYSVFDKSRLISDEWLGYNRQADVKIRSRIRDERLKRIRSRGLKYSSLDASNYHIDETLREISNIMTFSDGRVAARNLEALYDLLYDAQYLYDYGRKGEAEERLNIFASSANQLFMVYGEELKQAYIARVKNEYEYLSFATPSDALFDLKQVLQNLYLQSIRGKDVELETKFNFLKENLNTIAFYAEGDQNKNLKTAYENYMQAFKVLIETYSEAIAQDVILVQRQNQALDNLFTQYSALYRQAFFTDKLYVENNYLSLLPEGNNRLEEVQSVIAKRIDFLNRLQKFYLDGDVPLIDAQNILALLFSEISRIELPATYQVAVKDLFNERLQDYGIFSRFLNSQEYVSSALRGATPRERFEAFKDANTQQISIDQLQDELAKQAANGGNQYELGTIVPGEEVELPMINEEELTVEIDGTISTTENQVDGIKTKVPRVKPSV